MNEPVEMAGDNLKLKYRVRCPVSKSGKANYGGISGRPVRVGPNGLPKGIRKRPKGKTRFNG